jgi:hypothetical protein
MLVEDTNSRVVIIARIVLFGFCILALADIIAKTIMYFQNIYETLGANTVIISYLLYFYGFMFALFPKSYVGDSLSFKIFSFITIPFFLWDLIILCHFSKKMYNKDE